MIAYSPKMYPNAVTVRHITTAISAAGGDNPQSFTDVPALASVQILATNYAEIRTPDGGVQPTSITLLDVFFPSDPAVNLGDQILFDGRTIEVLGHAQNRGGFGVNWRVQGRIVD